MFFVGHCRRKVVLSGQGCADLIDDSEVDRGTLKRSEFDHW